MRTVESIIVVSFSYSWQSQRLCWCLEGLLMNFSTGKNPSNYSVLWWVNGVSIAELNGWKEQREHTEAYVMEGIFGQSFCGVTGAK